MLGLKITRVFQGYADLLEINGNPSWTKYVNDHRELLKNVSNAGGSPILMLTCIETGHILTITSLIDGRTNDNISAWIYIPDTIDSSTREFAKSLTDIITMVQHEFRATQLNTVLFQQVFARQYAPAPAKRVSHKSNGDKCAVRYYGMGVQYSLSEILQNLSQSYYESYKAVFLIDRASGILCMNCDDLTSTRLAELVVVYPPTAVDSFAPHIAGQPFTRPIYAALGENIEVDWVRKGYATIKKSSIVSASTQFVVPMRSEYRVSFPHSAITVKDDKGMSIKEYTLRINNTLVKPGGNVEISEDMITQSKVDISADGYEAQQFVRDLRSHLTITLKRSNLVYKFKVPSVIYPHYPNISFEISSKQPLAGCPLEGYALEDKKIDSISDNWLEYKPFTTKIKVWLIAIASFALLLGAVGGWGATYAYYSSKVKKLESKLRNAQRTPTTVDKKKEIIDYLNNNPRWDRKDMADIDPILVELWDHMNKGELQDILEMKKHDALRDSRKFVEVYNAVDERVKSGYNLGNPFTSGKTFNGNSSDTKITVKNFIETMKKRAPRETSNNQNARQQDKNKNQQQDKNKSQQPDKNKNLQQEVVTRESLS